MTTSDIIVQNAEVTIGENRMDDLIYRQAAIDALGERPMIWTGGDYELGLANQYDADVLALETVPAAQQPNWVDDFISRKWLLECIGDGSIKFDTEKDENTFIHLVRDITPSVQPTFYGYDIKHLAFVAFIMAKEGLSPEEAVAIFSNVYRATEMMLKEILVKFMNDLIYGDGA